MELPSQSGMISPTSDPGTDSDGEHMPSRAQARKSNKPLLEKKRRARINKSLEQLKGLVLEALKKDSARYSKLEKADILEMTVKHLREVQHHQMSVAMSVDPTVVSKFKNGFNECAQEVNRYLGTIDGLSPEVRMRLMQHLGNCANQGRQMALPSMPMFGVPAASPSQALPGMNMRCGLPFGGLAFPSPDSPSLPVSQANVYTPNEYRTNNSQFTPKMESHVSVTLRNDNRENIAPLRCQRPLGERINNNENTRSLERRNDRNNNLNMEAPPSKRQRLEVKSELQVPNDFVSTKRMNNLPCNEHVNNGVGHNLFEMNIKMEPVWRPW